MNNPIRLVSLLRTVGATLGGIASKISVISSGDGAPDKVEVEQVIRLGCQVSLFKVTQHGAERNGQRLHEHEVEEESFLFSHGDRILEHRG